MEETETLTARENLILRNESCVLRSLTLSLLFSLLREEKREEVAKLEKKNKKEREKLISELCLCDSVVVLLQQTQILDM